MDDDQTAGATNTMSGVVFRIDQPQASNPEHYSFGFDPAFSRAGINRVLKNQDRLRQAAGSPAFPAAHQGVHSTPGLWTTAEGDLLNGRTTSRLMCDAGHTMEARVSEMG